VEDASTFDFVYSHRRSPQCAQMSLVTRPSTAMMDTLPFCLASLGRAFTNAPLISAEFCRSTRAPSGASEARTCVRAGTTRIGSLKVERSDSFS
jgi:hypothetical protein